MAVHQHLMITLLAPNTAKGFSQLLEQGFYLEIPLGCSVRSLVCKHLGIDARYLEERIQTLFLDHNPVDNIDTAVIGKNAILALSAAMPGLAGATLRRGGRFATLRNQISRPSADEHLTGEKTTVTVKFFNMVAKEQGPALLREGIRVEGSSLAWFFDKHLDRLLSDIQSVRLDENEINIVTLATIEWRKEVSLQVVVAN